MEQKRGSRKFEKPAKLPVNAGQSKNKPDADEAREIRTARGLRGVPIFGKPAPATRVRTPFEKPHAGPGRQKDGPGPGLGPGSKGRKDGPGSSPGPTGKRNAPAF
ncbi:hypothetical protein LTS15_004139 [Exophiala xenobiotica]|nr:hypothetical protein LTS15_004139 [Exophiala xenobiotica]